MKLLFFSSPTCAPCAMMKPAFKTYVDDNQIEHEMVDVSDNPDAALTHKVRSVPTIIFMRGDDEIGRLTGAQPITKIAQMYDVQKTLEASFTDTQSY